MAETVSETASDDDLNARLSALEEELRSTKTQIQQILLDLREQVLEFTNPFTAAAKSSQAESTGNEVTRDR